MLLSNSATVSFAYTYDPWGVQTLTAGGGGNGAAQNPYAFHGNGAGQNPYAFHGNGAGQNPYAFHAGIKDPGSGLVKFGQRWYNPTTGTWTQQDTLDNPLDPANANRFAYAGDDPINNLDPTGNSPGSDVCYTEFVIEGLLVDGVIALAGLPTAGAAWAVGGIVDIALYGAAKAACG